MKSKAARVLLSAAFLVLLFVPGVLWLAVGGALTGPNLEKRELAEWPEFSLAEVESLPDAIEDYYRDHLPFREQLISAYARLNKAVFDDCVVTTVVFGQEDWYYYNNIRDGDPIASYRGEDLFTSQELRQIVIDLRKTRDNLAKQGIEFVLFIVPNKERVYPEYMPERYGEPAEDYAALQLVEFLRSHSDIRVVYAYDELMAAKAEVGELPIYYPTDTHWNDIGSYVGARALLKELGVEIPALAKENIRPVDAVCTGDLTVLAHLYTVGEGDPVYTIDDAGRPAVSMEMEKDMRWLRAQGTAKGKKLFIKHDSFAAGMVPYIIPWFRQTNTYTNALYEMEQVDEAKPDIFVQVCVERYVRQQLTKGPLYILPRDR